MVDIGDVWEVVGGATKGGIIVRQSKGISSQRLSDPLQTGSLVRVIESADGRMHYELCSGSGPSSGWVSAEHQGKQLLVRTGFKAGGKDSNSQDASTEASTSSNIGEDEESMLKEDSVVSDGEDHLALEKAVFSRDCQRAFNKYVRKFVVQPKEPHIDESINSDSLRYGCPESSGEQERVKVEVEKHLFAKEAAPENKPMAAKAKETLQSIIAKTTPYGQIDLRAARRCIFRALCQNESVYDDDGESVLLCCQCRLPLGDVQYMQDGKRCHAECMALLLAQEAREEEDARARERHAEECKTRLNYDIGWTAAKIPCNSTAAKRLTARDIPEGMVCVVFDEKTRTVRLASTIEPSAAVNLEYLSTCLKVRRMHGHEPIFSLDPVERGLEPHAMQTKMFSPEWLEGTSVGEVLFQSDYHLKELSMGAYDQPIVGMKSCFDHIRTEQSEETWSAREWFMVRKAEVHMSKHDLLIPFVKLGVEAREQHMGANAASDAIITRLDHPMVRYANEFTKYFDLIAERKSVIFHLRELAKASVLAKFLLEAHIDLDESWLRLGSEKVTCSVLEVPQLWNNSVSSTIEIDEDGKKGLARGTVVHGVYGGVQFGLEKFQLFGPARIPKSKPPIRRAVAGLPPVSRMSEATSAFLPPPLSLALPLSPAFLAPVAARSAPTLPRSSLQSMIAPGVIQNRLTWEDSAREGMAWSLKVLTDKGLMTGRDVPAAVEAARATTAAPEVKGVDLRLDDFDLMGVKKVSMEKPARLEKCMSLGLAFWEGLEDHSSAFESEDKDFLKSIYNEKLSDRRLEGDKFVPPDASFSYVSRLRDLLKEETCVRQRRKDAFFSEAFSMTKPGEMFPSTWISSIEISRGQTAVHTSDGHTCTAVKRCKDYEKEAALFDQVSKSVSPLFDKQTEEGTRFRIYRVGNLEFRSTQEMNSKEEVGVVYSVSAPSQLAKQRTALKRNPVSDGEKITKITEYVERSVDGIAGASEVVLHHHYYLVLETERKNKVMTELLPNGSIHWVENENFESRNSLAKVIQYADGSNRATVGQVRGLRSQALQEATQHGFSKASSKQYARCLLNSARTM